MKQARQIIYLLTASFLFFNTEILATMSIGGYNVYFGDLHNHCNVDDGGHATGTPAEAYSYARTRGGMDFFGLASHDLYITIEEWAAIGAAADAATVDGAFVGFRGFEWTTTPLGHIAIVNSGDYCTSTQTATNTFSRICSWIDARQECVAFLNHPGRQDATHVEFDHFSSTPASNVVGIELWNKTDLFRSYYYNDGYYSNDNSKSFFDEAITRGWQVGAGGGGDNHSGSWGTATSARLAILANNLTRTELLSALKARRFFSTLDKNLALSFTIGGDQMGSTISSANGLILQVLAYDGDGEIFTEVVVFDRNHNAIATRAPNSSSVNESLTLNTFSGDYFYVKVKQADGDEAISSPIMISGTQVNTPPVCALTAPIGNENYLAPAQVFVAATASDAGSIAKVTFFANNTMIGEDVSSPYEIYWNSAGAGTYTITAVASDDGGMMTTSAAVDLTIAAAQNTFTIEKRIATSSDDAEENVANGAVDATTSSDLELAYDAGLSKNQLVGIRFTGCTIPKNATITTAYVQFTCKETGSNSSNVVIKGETSVSPATFSTTAYSLSSRPKTTSSVAWTIPVWNATGAATANERTPNINSILQEIVNGVSYSPGSAIAFFFSGSGTRCAHSFSGSSAGAALLHVDYSTSLPVNTPPICAITSPADSAMFIGTTDVTITAVATDAAGMVTNVEFLLNDLVVGQDSTAPYSCAITGLESGSYRLAVRAIDDSSAVTTSAPHLITIRDQNLLPSCNITLPAGGSVFTAPASINIEASAVDGDGSVAKVEFFSNNNKIDEDFSSPFSCSWTNVAAGSYSLTAVATDNDGGGATSAAIDILVNTPHVNLAPTIATAATATPSPVTGTTTTLSVLGNDDNGESDLTYTWATTGTPPAAVTFGINGSNAAKITIATFTRAGSYTFAATIRDQGGLTVTSTVAVTVNQTLTNIVVSPTTASIATSATQQFTATARDQFATNFSTQPAFTWSVSGGGTISSGGLFTAGTAAGGPYTITVSSGSKNAAANVNVTAVASPIYRINCGSANAASPFTGDQYVSGGTQRTVTNAVTITGITNPAPQTVYQSERYGACTYTLPNLTANAQYTVRLHFAELYHTATGKRRFNVVVNGTTVLSNFDIYAVAGSRYKAVVQEFIASADGSGRIVLLFSTVTDNATIEGIEIIPAIPNVAPTIEAAASAAPGLVTGTTTTLSVLGGDDNGESALTYTWSATGTPPAAVTFNINGNNAAKTTTATFTRAGNYALQVTVKDAGNLTAVSTVPVTVDQTLTAVVISPATATIVTSATQQFTATACDQFATNLTIQPAFSWGVSDGGTVASDGVFTAGTSEGGPYTVIVTSGIVSDTANVTVIRVNLAPTIETAATATPGPVTGTTTTLSVLGNDDNGESNLTYTWATNGTPPAAVNFSNNGTNAAKNTFATFTRAGVYTFAATIRDQENLAVTSTVTVTVNQTLTSIAVSPITASIATSATQQFTATAHDQFATNFSTQPAFTWRVSGGGTISSGGLFTAGTAAGGPYSVTVSSGNQNASANVTVTAVASPVYRINCGSANAASPFTGDQYVSGGTQRTVTNAITISGITNPAPQTVYQSERYGTCIYTLPNLTAGAQYTVRLHFAELYQTATGKRRFNVGINGTTVLSNYDIYAVTGNRYKADSKEFTASANNSGQIIINLTTVTDNATISGIEVIRK